MIPDTIIDQLIARREQAEALRKEAKAAEQSLASSHHDGMKQYISQLREAADELIEANNKEIAKW